MVFHPVVERIAIVPVLDPLWLVLFTAIFLVSALLAARRPVYGLALLAFVTPFALAHGVLGTTVTLGKAVLIGVICGIAAGGRRTALPAPVRAILYGFTAVIAVDLVTLVVAQHRAEVIRETLKWVEYAAYFTAAYLCYALDPQPRIARAAIALSALAVAISALGELGLGAGSDLIVDGRALPRIAGALEGPNQLGGYLEIVIAALAAWQVRAPSRMRAALLALCGATLALCLSRSALLGIVVVLATIAAIERARIARLWSLIAGVAAGYAAMLVATPGLPPAALFGAIVGARASDVDAELSGGVGTRAELWHAALVLFTRHPVLGVGAGNYQYDLAQTGLYGVRTQANNWYLQTLAEGGIVLMGALLAWIGTLLRAVTVRAERSPWRVAALAATCAMIVHGFSDDLIFYPKVGDTWMVLLALGCVRTADP